MPHGYCGISLPSEPINIGAKFLVYNLEEVDEEKLSYTINLRYNIMFILFCEADNNSFVQNYSMVVGPAVHENQHNTRAREHVLSWIG